MNVCEPLLDRWLIPDTFACRKGLGRIKAVQRAAGFARQFGFFLKLDIRKYFDSISHAELLARLERRFKDTKLLILFRHIVSAHHPESGIGLPIGSLISQHLANFYLGWFDRVVREQWRIPGYVRYMDDMVLWENDRRKLNSRLADSRDWLSNHLRLSVKSNAHLNGTRHGMDFLGCRVFPDRIMLNRRSRRRFGVKMRNLEGEFSRGECDELELQRRATSLVAFTKAAGVSSWRFRAGLLDQDTGIVTRRDPGEPWR